MERGILSDAYDGAGYLFNRRCVRPRLGLVLEGPPGPPFELHFLQTGRGRMILPSPAHHRLGLSEGAVDCGGRMIEMYRVPYRKIAFADVSAAEAEAIKRATGRLIAAE